MSAESACIVRAYLNATRLKTISGNFRLVCDEPSSFSLVLDNSAGDYNADQPIANPRELSEYVTIVVDDGDSTYTTPQFVVEDYDYDTDTVVISGRCRLSELDLNDQVLDVGDGTATLEDSNLSTALGLIGTAYGFSFSGTPSRSIPGPYQMVGNPLQMVRDLLGPTHVCKMGSSNTILIESATTHSSATALTDVDDLEILRYRRTNDIYNKATVERIVQTGGWTELFDESHSGGDALGVQGPFDLSTPSRNLRFEILEGYRGTVDTISMKDSEGNPIGAQPLGGQVYIGNDVAHSFTFVYTPSDDANLWGVPWTPNWRVKVTGYPSTVEPVPTEGYSQTYSVGGGDRPYPEPFSSLLIADEATALAWATALVDRGTRIGNILNCSIRLRVDMPLANEEVPVSDHTSGIDETPLIEAVNVSWDENGDTGTIALECSVSESS